MKTDNFFYRCCDHCRQPCNWAGGNHLTPCSGWAGGGENCQGKKVSRNGNLPK